MSNIECRHKPSESDIRNSAQRIFEIQKSGSAGFLLFGLLVQLVSFAGITIFLKLKPCFQGLLVLK
jgi:hypothetical protein